MKDTAKHSKQLSPEERATIMLMTRDGKRVREIGRFLNRSPSTISRETGRNMAPESGYCATRASEQSMRLRSRSRKTLKLVVDGALWGTVVGHLKKK